MLPPGLARLTKSEGEGTDKSDGPEPQNGLLYCYEGTNIIREKAVKDAKMQLNDALIASYSGRNSRANELRLA